MGIYTDRRKTTTTPDGYELLMHESGHLEYDFNWHMGAYWSRYLGEMKDNKKIFGVKCPGCGTVYTPPRVACAHCYREMDEWVEVGPEGLLWGYTVVRFPYIDPNNGALMQVPFTPIWVLLDGSDTKVMHVCNELDEKKMVIGKKVRPVWAKEPRPASIHAIEYFEIIKGSPVAEFASPERMVGPIEFGAAKKKPAKKKPAAGKKKPAKKKPAAGKKKPAKKKPAAGKKAPKKKR